MIQQTYDKLSNTARLQVEIVAAGLPVDPNVGARFYGCLCNYTGTGSGYQTIVLCYDNITAGELTTIDGVVAAHIPTALPINGPLVTKEQQIFTNLAIRDTATYTSTTANNIGYVMKTMVIQNTLDQAVTKQCQGSRDGTNWFNIGDSFTVAAGVNFYATCETYFPYNRGLASCTVAPTTGTLNMWVESVGT